MDIIRINEETIAYGKKVFRDRLAIIFGGPYSYAYKNQKMYSGRRALVGVILACIENGLTAVEEIMDVTGRITCCRHGTIADLLDELTGSDPSLHLWYLHEGHYRDLRSALGIDHRPHMLLAA